ncbi:MAG: hypothetical protein AAB307_01685 [Deltaproteobacteria bacterium]
MSEFFSVFTSIQSVIASIGLILATASFISGLQLVKGASFIEGKVHRINGFSSITLYTVLAVLAFATEGLRIWSVLAWITGFLVILLKISIVRKRRRRSFKYVSWIGASLLLMWLFLVYIHIPV